MRGLLAAFCLVLLATLPVPHAHAQDQDDPTIVFNLTTDDVWSGQMALGLAQGMLDDGHHVVVFLNVRAATLANSNIPQHTEAMTGLTAHEMIARLIDGGARVFVCPGCTRQAGLDIDDRIEGVEPGSPELRQILMAPGTRIMSF